MRREVRQRHPDLGSRRMIKGRSKKPSSRTYAKVPGGTVTGLRNGNPSWTRTSLCGRRRTR
uniref:Uncharacterized protein n=1 Tax=Ralstonia solanacearum TaxID=305 RepID=A0A0S4TPE2_RALSL|nr:protein of unknown function [Ralstonia solanacearum]